jgi:hypothetical protein
MLPPLANRLMRGLFVMINCADSSHVGGSYPLAKKSSYEREEGLGAAVPFRGSMNPAF